MKIWTIGGRWETFKFHNLRGTYWPAEGLLVSPERFCVRDMGSYSMNLLSSISDHAVSSFRLTGEIMNWNGFGRSGCWDNIALISCENLGKSERNLDQDRVAIGIWTSHFQNIIPECYAHTQPHCYLHANHFQLLSYILTWQGLFGDIFVDWATERILQDRLFWKFMIWC
jgi:hypothetical protein